MKNAAPAAPARFVVEALSRDLDYPVAVRPDAAARAAFAAELNLTSLDDLELTGTLEPEGAHGWRLDARLTAAIGQVCVVTLEPLRSVIDEAVGRAWLPAAEIDALPADFDPDGPDGPDPLADEIDLMAVIGETLALAIDPYPRAEGAEVDAALSAPPGVEPLTDEAARPFAGLAALRRRLAGDDG